MRHIHCKLLLALAFLLITLPAFGAETRGVKQTVVEKASGEARNRALIIGNNDHLHWPPLKTAVHDAEALASLLTASTAIPRMRSGC